MSGNRLPDRQPRSSALLTGFLVALTIAGLAVTAAATAYAVLANTTSNRQGNPLAGIAVAIGAEVAIASGVVTMICITALVVSLRRRR